MLSVLMLSVFRLSVLMRSVVRLSVLMRSVVRLSVIMLIVEEPFRMVYQCQTHQLFHIKASFTTRKGFIAQAQL
jgi:hypothetical protein